MSDVESAIKLQKPGAFASHTRLIGHDSGSQRTD
jgi:hypothetical protein